MVSKLNSVPVLGRLASALLSRGGARWLPLPPRFWRRRYLVNDPVWHPNRPGGSTVLRRSGAAIHKRPQDEDLAAEHEPLSDFRALYRDQVEKLRALVWPAMLPFAPQILRALRREARVEHEYRLEGAGDSDGASTQTSTSPVPDLHLTERVRDWAVELGISQVGIAEYDSRYTFKEFIDGVWFPTVLVCVLEQEYEHTQSIPGIPGERAAFAAYGELVNKSAELAERLRTIGYRAVSHDHSGRAIAIHYAVEAGLGQLGLNGQLLTPRAGSRCRLVLMTTDAPLVRDAPADFGIEAICDECQVCVARCPVGAIPSNREWHRGVLKAKLNTKRCFPVIAQTSGCAICMKVCPVQKFGLEDVSNHFEETGEILGKGTDELEAYTWPMDGQLYGPGEKPRNANELVDHPDFQVSGTSGHPDRRESSGSGERGSEEPTGM